MLTSTNALAGALAPAPGDGAVQLTGEAFVATARYDDDGVATSFGETAYRRQQVRLHGVIGLMDRLELRFSLPLVAASVTAPGEDTVQVVGVGDAVVDGGWRFLDDGTLVLRGGLSLKVPLYQAKPSLQGFGPVGSPARPGGVPALGDGQADMTLWGSFGARFPFDGFFEWGMGYRLRTSAVTDAIVGAGSFELATLDDRLRPRWDLDFVYSFDPPRDDEGEALETIGAGSVTTGPGVRVSMTANLSLDVSAKFVFRARNTVGGFLLATGFVYGF